MVSPSKDESLLAMRLKIARKKMKISQMELGVRAGIDEFSASARINQYERGKHSPDFNTARTLAKVLGIPTAYLYCEDDSLAEFIARYGELTTTQKNAVIQFAKSL